jgi:hypothetical protein
MPSLSQSDFKILVEENNGDEEAARALLNERGYTVEGEEARDLSARPDMAALKGILTNQRQSIGDLYDKITQNIQQRYRAPDINDLLISIGTGMMSAPQEGDNSGFAGAIQRGIRGLGPYAQSRRAYETDMNQMMSNIEIQKAKDLADLEGKYATGAASLLKPKTPSSSSPVIANPGEPLRTRATGSVIKEPPQPAIYELQAYLSDPSNTPQNKAIAKRTFDGRFGYGAADIFGGQQ